MTLQIDRGIFSDACISRVVYWLSGQYVIQRSLQDNLEILTIEGCIDDESSLTSTIMRQLNDYKLREVVEHETHDIRTILYAKAFADCEDLEA